MLGPTLVLMLFAGSLAELPPGAVLRLGDHRFRAAGEVRHLRFSADCTLLTGWVFRTDGFLRPVAWNSIGGFPCTSTPLRSPPEWNEGTTPSVRLGGNRILTAGPGNAGRVWDATTARQLAQLTGHIGRVTAVARSADGKRLATASDDGLVRVWDGETFRPLSEPHGHIAPVRAIRISADGKRAATLADDGTARVWNLTTGSELRALPTTGPVDLTRDGLGLVIANRDASQPSAIPLPSPSAKRGVSASEPERQARDNENLAWRSGSDLGSRSTRIVRDVLTGTEIVPDQLPALPELTVSDWLAKWGIPLAVSPSGTMVAVAHPDGTIGLYEQATWGQRRELPGHGSRCCALAFTPDGSRLLTAGEDHTVLVWDVRPQAMPLPVSVQRETNAAKLWATMSTGKAAVAYLAMARLAVEPAAAVATARMRTRPADVPESNAAIRLADTRAIELLESLGTPEAGNFLRELAGGNASAWRTQEARRALERMRK
ncbi:MAG: hypothetical protein C0467_26780 [Planctomycetaceae bacterium]|nr:hypothetical protein [Planctomycetaceae bacterium]